MQALVDKREVSVLCHVSALADKVAELARLHEDAAMRVHLVNVGFKEEKTLEEYEEEMAKAAANLSTPLREYNETFRRLWTQAEHLYRGVRVECIDAWTHFCPVLDEAMTTGKVKGRNGDAIHMSLSPAVANFFGGAGTGGIILEISKLKANSAPVTYIANPDHFQNMKYRKGLEYPARCAPELEVRSVELSADAIERVYYEPGCLQPLVGTREEYWMGVFQTLKTQYPQLEWHWSTKDLEERYPEANWPR